MKILFKYGVVSGNGCEQIHLILPEMLYLALYVDQLLTSLFSVKPYSLFPPFWQFFGGLPFFLSFFLKLLSKKWFLCLFIEEKIEEII